MTDSTAFTQAFDPFRGTISGNEPAWLTDQRSAAIGRFESLGVPTTRSEDWLYTDLRPLVAGGWNLSGRADEKQVRAAMERAAFEDFDRHLLVFVNGQFDGGSSSVGSLPQGVTLSGLTDALDKHGDFVQAHLNGVLDMEKYSFQALNTAFMGDGLFLRVAEGVKLEKPVHVMYISAPGAERMATYPRTLIVLEPGADATVIETHIGPAGVEYFTNAASEIVVEREARLRYHRVLRDGERAFHFNTTAIRQAEATDLKSATVMLGGSLIRNDMFAVLKGNDAFSSLNGLYFLHDDQQVDNFTRVKHVGLNCNSRQIFKGILDDRSRGVFDGRIYVNEGAQLTDAVQTNRNLLLSDDAVAYAKPQLEIYADDVKCTHGATTGQLEKDHLFYLQSRGFDLATARAILTYAFAGEIIDEIGVDAVRTQLQKELMETMMS